jgi:hypothetical protein
MGKAPSFRVQNFKRAGFSTCKPLDAGAADCREVIAAKLDLSFFPTDLEKFSAGDWDLVCSGDIV